MQAKLHFGVVLDELLDHGRQGIACLRVGGGDGEFACLLILEFLSHLLQVRRIQQHARRHFRNDLAGVGQCRQALAVAHEDIDAQFLLQ